MDLFTKIKSITSFTESEQIFIQYILDHPYDVIQLSLQQLAKTSYVSISTIYRVMEKLDINGLNQLKLQISESLKNNKEDIKTIYFPKQKVIFFEENKNIKDQLKLKIVFPDEQEIIYIVEVMKYWEYSDEELREKKMYPLMPLQLFKLRKELEKAHNKNDLNRIKELSNNAKVLASKLAKESAILNETRLITIAE